MSEILTKDLVTYDPLSEITRKERRSLLGLCVLGIGLVKVPLVPTKFSTFGIEFSNPNQQAFVFLYAAVVAYFLLAFQLYALTDYVAWRRSQAIFYREYLRANELARKSLGDKLEKKVQDQFVDKNGCPYRGFASYRVATVTSSLRAVFEFVLPLLLAAYTLVVLIQFVPKP